MRKDIKKGATVAWIWHSGPRYGVRAGIAIQMVPRGTSAFKYLPGGAVKSFSTDIDYRKDRVLIFAETEKGPKFYCRDAASVTLIQDGAVFCKGGTACLT